MKIAAALSAAALLPLLFLAGCSTGAQVEYARLQKAERDTTAAGTSCEGRATEKPDYDLLKKKMYLSPGTQFPLKYLTDNSYPTKKEIEALFKLHAELQECRRIYLEGASKTHPLVLTMLVDSFAQSDKLWAEAASGKMTWGKFNEGRKELTAQSQSQLAEANVRIGTQLQNQHAFEIEQRQRAMASLQQWSYQQQVLNNQQQYIDSLNKPRTINCRYVGTTLQCNSF